MNWVSPQDEEDCQIATWSGTPAESAAPSERSRFEWFAKLLRRCNPFARDATDLGIRVANAKVEQEEGEAAIRAAQAAHIAAQAERHRSKEVSVVFDLIDRLDDESQSDEARLLKLTKLFHEYPELAQQFEEVQTILERLRLTRGVRVELKGSPELSAAIEDDTEDL